MPSPIRTFLERHWRGELSLPASYWGVCVVGNALFIAVIWTVAFALRHEGFHPWLVAGVLGVAWLAALALLAFQSVGTWRAAGRYWGLKLGGKLSAFWAIAARTAVIAGILAMGAQFVQVGAPQLLEAGRMVLLDDPGIPDYSVRLMRDGTEAEIAGGFKYGLARDAEKLFGEAPNLKIVHLNSGGGRLGEATKLAQLIRQRGLSTYSSASCSSACVIAFLAGRERWLKAGAKLGFHRESFAGVESTDAMRKLLLEAGLDAAFVERAVTTPAGSMWYPTTAELLAAKAITGVADDYRFAASGYGSKADALTLAAQLRQTPLFAAIEEADVDVFNTIVDSFYRAYLEGQPEGRILDEMRSRRVTPIIMSRLNGADDALLADYARLMADQYEALGGLDVTACYRYAALGADTATVNMLPPALRQREMELSQRVLGSTVKRPTPSLERVQPIYRTISEKLTAQYGAQQVRLLADPARVPPIEYGNYCKLAVALFRTIAGLPPEQAGEVMSHVFAKSGRQK